MSNAWFESEKNRLRQQNGVQLELLSKLGSKPTIKSPSSTHSPSSEKWCFYCMNQQ